MVIFWFNHRLICQTDTVGVGKMHDIDTFDASAFKMHSKLVRSCDPTTTQTLERAFEAIIDAGKANLQSFA